MTEAEGQPKLTLMQGGLDRRGRILPRFYDLNDVHLGGPRADGSSAGGVPDLPLTRPQLWKPDDPWVQ